MAGDLSSGSARARHPGGLLIVCSDERLLLMRGPSAPCVRAAGTKWRHGDLHYHRLISTSSAHDSRLRFLHRKNAAVCAAVWRVKLFISAARAWPPFQVLLISGSTGGFIVKETFGGHKAHLNVRITADPCTHQNFCDSLFIFSPLLYFSGPQRWQVQKWPRGCRRRCPE